jgi:hypothetical protein
MKPLISKIKYKRDINFWIGMYEASERAKQEAIGDRISLRRALRQLHKNLDGHCSSCITEYPCNTIALIESRK